MANKEMRFRKISLELLLDTLTHLWDAGADYVDIIGIQNEDQDIINIVVKEEYMSEEEPNDESDEEPPTTLSDEDINNLI